MTDPINIPCYPAIGINGWTFTLTPDLARRIVALAQADVPNVVGCSYNPDSSLLSSRICQRGQKGCIIDHDASPDAEVARLKADLAAMTERAEAAERDANHYQIDLQAHVGFLRDAEAQRDKAITCLAEMEAERKRARDAVEAQTTAEDQLSSDIATLTAQRDRLAGLLDPRTWGDSENAAWHRNIPDMHAAFAALRALAELDHPTPTAPTNGAGDAK